MLLLVYLVAYCGPILAAAFFAWLGWRIARRSERSLGVIVGAGLMGAAALGMVGPWAVTEVRATLDARAMRAATIWPPPIEVAGRDILVVGRAEDLPATLRIDGEAASVHVAQSRIWAEPETLWTRRGEVEIDRRFVRRIDPIPEVPGEHRTPWSYRVQEIDIDRPTHADLVILASDQDDIAYGLDGADVPPVARVEAVRWSLHVFAPPEGRIDRLPDAALVGRLLQARPETITPFVPLQHDATFRPHGDEPNALLSEWICGNRDCASFFPPRY